MLGMQLTIGNIPGLEYIVSDSKKELKEYKKLHPDKKFKKGGCK